MDANSYWLKMVNDIGVAELEDKPPQYEEVLDEISKEEAEQIRAAIAQSLKDKDQAQRGLGTKPYKQQEMVQKTHRPMWAVSPSSVNDQCYPPEKNKPVPNRTDAPSNVTIHIHVKDEQPLASPHHGGKASNTPQATGSSFSSRPQTTPTAKSGGGRRLVARDGTIIQRNRHGQMELVRPSHTHSSQSKGNSTKGSKTISVLKYIVGG